MTDVSQNKKDSILKSLAIAGFLGIIILIAWLSIRFVNVVPEAFSSLASLAEGLNQQKESTLKDDETSSLVITSNKVLVNAGEPVELVWGKANTPGSFTFTYKCIEGVAVDIVNLDGLKSIACDTNYNIGDTSSLILSVDSEKERYTDLDYTISFLATNDTVPRATGNASLTVINSSVGTFTDEESAPETTVDTVASAPETSAEETVVETTVPEVKPTTPTYEQEFVYTIPVSDPKGRTDLATRYLNVGSIVGNTFFAGQVKQNESGAVQFEVKNNGSKTSEKWTYEVTLPNGGTYTSTAQNPLKPNERAVLTIGFPTSDTATHTFKVTVDEASDKNTTNNKFSQVVTFVK